jgi:NitT/TauT family transport system substrate-binding protein
MMSIDRRKLLGYGGALAGGAFLDFRAFSETRPVVNLQLGWILGGNQVGEVCAKALGYYGQEGIDLAIQPGGPNIDGVAVVASGRYEAGQVSSSPSLMLAASQDIPVVCFGVGAQEHPYTFFSLPRKPVRKPADMAGKKVGIQATGVILLKAMLAKNNVPLKDVEIVPIGAEMAPLLTGQVDVVTGWLTNTTALKVLGPDRIDLRLWDTGVRLYGLPYYATSDTLKTKRDMLAKFMRATGKGWAFAYDNRDKAVDYLVKEFSNLVWKDERESIDDMMKFAFSPKTKAEGWGTMDPRVWQEQIDTYAELGQFSKRTPKLDEVMTLDILEASADARPKIG